jgi:hypothetical protein
MSFGFDDYMDEVGNALEKARDAGIIVFAAMSNTGRHRRAAWPARTAENAIGIHSCGVMGKNPSDFTPDPIKDNHNFMVVGEAITAHQLTAKGGGFTTVDGTSFATPVAVSMAALILGFANQAACKKLEKPYNVGRLRSKWGMRNVLYEISKESGDYSWIRPVLLWHQCFFGENEHQFIREWGLTTICTALEQGP